MKEIFVRRSVRKFDTSKKVSRTDLIEITKAGFYAPSARNQQPWNFVIIDDEKVIEELRNVSTHATALMTCNTIIAIVCSDLETLPTPAYISQDLACCQLNLMLKATSMNLGSCWVSIYPNDERIKVARKVLNIPSNLIPFSLCAIGYPESIDALKQADRYKEERIHFNRF